MDNQIDTKRFLGRIYNESLREYACRAGDRKEFELWQQKARPKLRELVGLPRIAETLGGDFSPTVELEEEEDMGTYSRQACRLLSEPDVWVPFWLLRPHGEGPFPIGVFPHGHEQHGMNTYVGIPNNEQAKEKIRNEDRDVAVQAVRRGMVAIAPTTRGFFPATIPDRQSRHGGQHCRSQAIHAYLAGRTAIGERVWDMERFLDWACALPYTDPSRILVMGNSGGGMVTIYTAACDPRVCAAIPSCSFCSFAGPGGDIHHCDCNAVPGIMAFGEFWDVAGLIAPRNLLTVNGAQDPLFPLSEVDRAVEALRRIYETAGVPSNFEHHYGPGGHRFYSDIMWPFIERVL